MRTFFGTALGRAEMKAVKGGCGTPGGCGYVWWYCDNCYVACFSAAPPVESVAGCPGSSTNCVRSTTACTNEGYVSCC